MQPTRSSKELGCKLEDATEDISVTMVVKIKKDIPVIVR